MKGDVIEAELEIKNNFVNITGFNLIQPAHAQLAGPVPITAITAPEIALRKAEIIVTLWAAGKLNADHPLVTKLLIWLGGKAEGKDEP